MSKVKVVAIAAAAIGAGLIAVPSASACGSCLSQPAMIDSTVITRPAVIDRSIMAPTVLTQPAVIETAPVVAPVYRDIYRRRSLLRVDTPLGGFHLF